MVFHGDTEDLTCILIHTGKAVIENKVLADNGGGEDLGQSHLTSCILLNTQVFIIYYSIVLSSHGTHITM